MGAEEIQQGITMIKESFGEFEPKGIAREVFQLIAVFLMSKFITLTVFTYALMIAVFDTANNTLECKSGGGASGVKSGKESEKTLMKEWNALCPEKKKRNKK